MQRKQMQYNEIKCSALNALWMHSQKCIVNALLCVNAYQIKCIKCMLNASQMNSRQNAKIVECTRNETKWCYMQTNASKMRRAKRARIQGKTSTHPVYCIVLTVAVVLCSDVLWRESGPPTRETTHHDIKSERRHRACYPLEIISEFRLQWRGDWSVPQPAEHFFTAEKVLPFIGASVRGSWSNPSWGTGRPNNPASR